MSRYDWKEKRAEVIRAREKHQEKMSKFGEQVLRSIGINPLDIEEDLRRIKEKRRILEEELIKIKAEEILAELPKRLYEHQKDSYYPFSVMDCTEDLLPNAYTQSGYKKLKGQVPWRSVSGVTHKVFHACREAGLMPKIVQISEDLCVMRIGVILSEEEKDS